MSELEQRLARIEAAARRRTLVVTVLLLGTTFAVLYLSTVAVTTARRERDEAVEAKREAEQGRQRAIDSLHAVNEDSEQREQAAGMMHEEAVKLGSQQRAQEQEIDRLRRARDRLLDAIEKGRGSEAAVSVMLELVERHQAAQETAAARKWLDRALRLAPDDALAKELDAQLGGGGG